MVIRARGSYIRICFVFYRHYSHVKVIYCMMMVALRSTIVTSARHKVTETCFNARPRWNGWPWQIGQENKSLYRMKYTLEFLWWNIKHSMYVKDERNGNQSNVCLLHASGVDWNEEKHEEVWDTVFRDSLGCANESTLDIFSDQWALAWSTRAITEGVQWYWFP